MPDELPIACSLSAADLPERLQQMALLGRDALLDAHVDGRYARLRFAAGEGVRERVDAIVAAESRCCAFLTMRVTGEPDVVALSIDAPEDAEPVLAELVDAFTADAVSG
jgi:hypothetical protein